MVGFPKNGRIPDLPEPKSETTVVYNGKDFTKIKPFEFAVKD